MLDAVNGSTGSRALPVLARTRSGSVGAALKDARVENSSMLNRLPRDGLSEISRRRRYTHRDAHPRTAGTPADKWLLADAEFGNDGLVALGIVFLEVVEQATALADQHEKSAARAVVFLVRFEVLRQLANPFAEQSDLDFRAARIAGMRAVLVNEGFLLLSG
jgi:hypothetical protein